MKRNRITSDVAINNKLARMLNVPVSIDMSEYEAFFLMFDFSRDEEILEIDGDLAIINIEGAIEQNGYWADVTTTEIEKAISKAVGNDDVETIILNINSPGGHVDGIDSLAKYIYESRDKKRIIAVANSSASSAAYWIASAAEKIYLSEETATVGSIGVVIHHRDISKMEEKYGVKTTEIFAGEYKRMASRYKPLTEEGERELKKGVTQIHEIFKKNVALFQSLSVELINEVGNGQIFRGKEAIKNKLAHEILSFKEIKEKYMGKTGKENKNELTKTGANTDKDIELTVASLQEKHPKVYNSVFQAGIKAENDRIKAISDVSKNIPKNEATSKLIEEAKNDSNVDPKDFAIKLLSSKEVFNSKTKETSNTKTTLQEDAPPTVVTGESSESKKILAKEEEDAKDIAGE